MPESYPQVNYLKVNRAGGMNGFESYLNELDHWTKSRFYVRADISSHYFWKLKNGYRYASPELIHRVWKATEGRVDLDEILDWFQNIRKAGVRKEVLGFEPDQ